MVLGFASLSTLLGLAASAASAPSLTFQQGLDDDVLTNVRDRLLEAASQSWELGTAAEALTEVYWPTLAVFQPTAFPPSLNGSYNASSVLAIADTVVAEKPSESLMLIEEGAVGDPASIGNAVLLANWTRQDLSNANFSIAAGEELDYLLNQAPRTDDGAISHRNDQVQLWADFIYMAPPFIAYFGALQGGDGGKATLQVAYDQIRLYRNYLRDDNGLWRHVTLGTWQDNTHWGTGNGWVAAGMLRVMETMANSEFASDFEEQCADLSTWIQEIVNAAWTYQKPNGTLYNVLDDDTSFADSSSTALLASVTYRMATLTNDLTYIPNANLALQLIESSLDSDGWLLNTVDPYTFSRPTASGSHSPEGQAFVLLLHAGWRDYIAWLVLQVIAGNMTI
ncbi:Six-hairpin glycosidase [Punctularia strigosozonata HHB-11173 SS5]|uniref:Six-hairpin glycosidase n=1 Tax=Punctularia strigosozonata (strain HHB-11173) TaxID=741275 RepID=UPI00044172C0|nr:Six-hairpin glycosidase [Punctularia strigosozonata HHB-11173 SS5]EIN10295.1 Six-hairpin glycosidase [Punctularia strigosozonata HHB-11173 SS5]